MSMGMDDSGMFIQWAMETLQHEHLAAAFGGDGDTFPSLKELPCSELHNGTAPMEAAAQGGHHESTPGGAVVEKDGWSSNCSVGSTADPPVSSNFTSTMAQPPSIHDEASPTARARAQDVSDEPAHRSPASRKRSLKSAASMGAGGTPSSLEPCVQEHVMAERKRREKISRGFIQLSTVIPGLKKMDKATILSDAVRYIKEQQEKLKELEDLNMRSVDSVVQLVKRPCIATKADGGATGSSLPEIEARILERNVIVNILCEDGNGVLVMLLAEMEGLHLSITHTNVTPFAPCAANITIMAKVDEGFNLSPEDIVGKLDAMLRRCHSGK